MQPSQLQLDSFATHLKPRRLRQLLRLERLPRRQGQLLRLDQHKRGLMTQALWELRQSVNRKRCRKRRRIWELRQSVRCIAPTCVILKEEKSPRGALPSRVPFRVSTTPPPSKNNIARRNCPKIAGRLGSGRPPPRRLRNTGKNARSSSRLQHSELNLPSRLQQPCKLGQKIGPASAR